MSLRYLFVDMNAFFASVEQEDRPELRGRPVGVVPTMADTTCCIAASYEAKPYGIKTGTKVADARRLCPAIRFIEARPRLYVEYHHRVIQAVESCLHVDAVCSIDEMYGRLLGREQQPPQAIEIANRVKAALRDQVGQHLRCSVGLGPNAWLAKVASDMQKPDGLTTILPEDLPHKLHGLELTDLPGIARGMQRRLNACGVRTVAGLCELSEADLAQACDSRVMGALWWHRLHGRDTPDRPTRRRSVSHSHVLPPNRRTEPGSHAVMVRMIHKAGFRLRRLGYRAGCIAVSVRFLDGSKWKSRASLGCCSDTLTMLRAMAGLWPHKPTRKPLKVSVVLTDLVPEDNATAPLFGQQQRLDTLAGVMDRLDRKYGQHTVCSGAMLGAMRAAPTRIAFNHIPNQEDFQPQTPTQP